MAAVAATPAATVSGPGHIVVVGLRIRASRRTWPADRDNDQARALEQELKTENNILENDK